MPYVNNGSIRIYYETVGNGPPLVLQHGMFWSSAGWKRLGYVAELEKHFCLVLIDARGHGRSSKPHDSSAYSLRSHVNDIISVLDAESLTRTRYWGFSMGGWFGFGLAAYASERLDSLVVGGAHPYGRTLTLESTPDGSDPETFLGAFFKRMGLKKEEMAPENLAEFYDNDFLALAAAQQSRPSLEEEISDLERPLLLYAGTEDAVYPGVKKCASQLSGTQLLELPGLNHPESFYRRELVMPVVIEFLLGNEHVERT